MTRIILALAALLPVRVAAHPGHGPATDPSGILHWLGQHQGAALLACAGVIGLGVILFRATGR